LFLAGTTKNTERKIMARNYYTANPKNEVQSGAYVDHGVTTLPFLPTILGLAGYYAISGGNTSCFHRV